jgi:hypothetical protein
VLPALAVDRAELNGLYRLRERRADEIVYAAVNSNRKYWVLSGWSA